MKSILFDQSRVPKYNTGPSDKVKRDTHPKKRLEFSWDSVKEAVYINLSARRLNYLGWGQQFRESVTILHLFSLYRTCSLILYEFTCQRPADLLSPVRAQSFIYIFYIKELYSTVHSL